MIQLQRFLALVAVVLFFGLAAASAVQAQGSPSLPPPPTTYSLDGRGVDVATGRFNYSVEQVSIGQGGPGGLSFINTYVGAAGLGGWRDNFAGTLNINASSYSISIGPLTDRFTKSGSVFIPASANGSSLAFDATAGLYTYTTSSGVVALFSTGLASDWNQWSATGGMITRLIQPNDLTLTFNYSQQYVCLPGQPLPCDDPETGQHLVRLNSVVSNTGYRILITYQISGHIPDTRYWDEWSTRTKVTAYNDAVSCTTCVWPSVTYGGAVNIYDPFKTATDELGRVTTYTYGAGGLTSVKLPGSSTADMTVAYNSTTSRTQTVTTGGGAWAYGYSDAGANRTTTVAAPSSAPGTTTYVSSLTTALTSSVTDPLSHTRSFIYDANGRMTSATEPEGDKTVWAYDARGNILSTTRVDKPGSSLADIVISAAYPSTCANPVVCNQPTTSTDPRGAVTNYTYDATHGGPLTVTAPAPSVGGVRPQTRYTYAAFHAWRASGQDPTTVTLPTQMSQCATTASCANGADEVRTTIGYGAAAAPNNLLPATITSGSGNGALTATTTMTYTRLGQVETVDGPLSGTSDKTQYRYDDAGQQIGVVGPDPDGSGSLKNRAIRNTYSPRGQITLAEQGTTAGYTDANWAAFAPLQKMATAYDAHGRPTHQRLQAGSTTYALQQATYDARGRVTCMATRMNPATFAAPPASACTAATAGTFGPDRIVQSVYNAGDQLTSTTTALGTTAAATETAAYSANGLPLTLTDGQGHVSTMAYDGFDRLYRLYYPKPTGTGSSTTDYDQSGYDAASNVTTYRTRAAQTFTTTYDALNRTTLINAPTGTADVTYAYDNLDRVLSASQTGHAQTFAWDALSRMTSQASPLGTFAYQYDLADQRTRITWPDGFYAQYAYDLYGGVTRIGQNGATSGIGILAAYSYDDLGRRTGTTRGDGVSSSYGYDPVSRLTSLSHNLAGTASDLTLTFAYNPAGQITSRTASNDAYAWTSGTNAALDYTNNGLNQVTAVEGQAVTYDANGNITADGMNHYTYDAANRLLSTDAHAYGYDALGQLYQMDTRRMARVDGQPVSVHSASGAVYRRFVPGPWTDESVAYYYGAGTDDVRWLLADERGSMIAYALDTGAAARTLAYDEYGVPRTGNTGYLEYTGQFLYDTTEGLYDYKSRVYAARLGRFLQTDPVGYAAGANLYNYVGSDPVNWVDPAGLAAQAPGDPLPCTQWFEVCTPIVVTAGGGNCGWYCYMGLTGWGGGGNPFQAEFGRGGGGGQQYVVPTNNARSCQRVQSGESKTLGSQLGGLTVMARVVNGGANSLQGEATSQIPSLRGFSGGGFRSGFGGIRLFGNSRVAPNLQSRVTVTYFNTEIGVTRHSTVVTLSSLPFARRATTTTLYGSNTYGAQVGWTVGAPSEEDTDAVVEFCY